MPHASTHALVGPEPRLTYALINAVAVLIIACPCAVGLATPLVVDKTGTLTLGRPRRAALRRRRRRNSMR